MTRWSMLSVLMVVCACQSAKDGKGSGDDSGIPVGGLTDVDADGVLSDTDCNDANAAVFPGAVEACNGLDDDCNGTVDDALGSTFYRDADADGYGDPTVPADACAQPTGFVSNADDCDDTDDAIHPESAESCDLVGADEDCDGLVNEADPSLEGVPSWYEDHDEDGYGDPALTVESCFDQPGLATLGSDCDDSDYGINPGTPELCDPLDKDEDCDGFSDEDDPEGPLDHPLYYIDLDHDDHGDDTDPGQYFCGVVPNDYVTDNTDCDDTNDVINLDAPEHCADAIDNDCNGSVDDCGPIADIPVDTSDTILTGDTNEYFGMEVASLGDLNGDGEEDFGSSAPYAASYSGLVWIFEGPVAPGTFEANDVVTATIEGTAYTYLGQSLSTAGDVDADGYDDLIAGNFQGGGHGYIVLGPVAGDSSISTTADAVWSEEISYDYGGYAVGGAFDFDSDGFDDFLVGAPYADFSTAYSTGAAYLVYGPGLETDSLANADAKIGVLSSYAYAGWAVSGLGDMDGDGADDFAVGAWGYNSYAGRAYVFTGGSLAATVDADSDATVYYSGVSTSDYLGYELADGGDFNDDGYADLLVSATYADSGTYLSGSAYIVPGPPSSSGSISTYKQAEFYGEVYGDQAGQAIDGSMDVNRDGFTDVLVGVPYYDSTGGLYSLGGTYLVYGPQTGTTSLANARCAIVGITSNENSGAGVTFIGDQDGDSSPEILTGAYYSSIGTSYGGAGYIVHGDRL